MSSLLKRIMIIDNNQDVIESIKTFLSGYTWIQVVYSTINSDNIINEIGVYSPDLIFLNIEMPGRKYFEVIKDIHKTSILTYVIFVTDFQKIDIEATRYSAIDYLSKPINPVDLQNALLHFYNRTVQYVPNTQIQVLKEIMLLQNNKLKFNTHTGFFMLAPEEIVFIQADWNYSELFISDTKSELVTINIGKLDEMLPNHIFYRINRSIIINLNYLTKVNRKKRSVILEKEGKEYAFKIPVINLRKIENFLDNSSAE
jgi:two-component system LytT family response regulator